MSPLRVGAALTLLTLGVSATPLTLTASTPPPLNPAYVPG